MTRGCPVATETLEIHSRQQRAVRIGARSLAPAACGWCGSTLAFSEDTLPAKIRPGQASAVTSTVWPTAICPSACCGK